MSEVIDLGSRRFGAAEDAAEAKPADALRYVLKGIEGGSFQCGRIVIVYDDGDVLTSVAAGVNRYEVAGMLMLAMSTRFDDD